MLCLGYADSGVGIGVVLGLFQYTAFDSTNAVIEHGKILLGKKESGLLAGRCGFPKAAAANWQGR